MPTLLHLCCPQSCNRAHGPQWKSPAEHGTTAVVEPHAQVLCIDSPHGGQDPVETVSSAGMGFCNSSPMRIVYVHHVRLLQES